MEFRNFFKPFFKLEHEKPARSQSEEPKLFALETSLELDLLEKEESLLESPEEKAIHAFEWEQQEEREWNLKSAIDIWS